jgi:hypothetical protein
MSGRGVRDPISRCTPPSRSIRSRETRKTPPGSGGSTGKSKPDNSRQVSSRPCAPKPLFFLGCEVGTYLAEPLMRGSPFTGYVRGIRAAPPVASYQKCK